MVERILSSVDIKVKEKGKSERKGINWKIKYFYRVKMVVLFL